MLGLSDQAIAGLFTSIAMLITSVYKRLRSDHTDTHSASRGSSNSEKSQDSASVQSSAIANPSLKI
jgi:hypothetical protein